MGMRGVYQEIVAPERTVHLESFDDYPGESIITSVLTEADGRTTLVATVLYPSQEVRDAVIRSGMEHGAAETYDKLAELLVSIGKGVGAAGKGIGMSMAKAGQSVGTGVARVLSGSTEDDPSGKPS